MLGATHIVNTLAIVSTPLLFGYTLTTSYVVLAIFVLIGSILPDIDEPDSIIGKRLGFISYPINILFGHRTITHNILVVVALSVASYTYSNFYCLAITIGMFIHIMQDSLTYQGIKGALFPLQRYNYNFVLLPRIFRFEVGGFTELIIFALSVVYLLYILYTLL